MKNLQNFCASLSTSLYTLSAILLLNIANTASAQNEYFEGSPNWNVNAEGIGFGFYVDYSVYGDSTINNLEYKWISAFNYSFYDEAFFITIDQNNEEIAQCLVRSVGKEMFWHNPENEEDE
jgi:hypothetical protein